MERIFFVVFWVNRCVYLNVYIFGIVWNFFLYFDFLGIGVVFLFVVFCVGGEVVLCK